MTQLVDTNQAPPFENINLYAHDLTLRAGVGRYHGAWADTGLDRLGDELSRPESWRLGHDANRHGPELRTHDRYGERIDQVVFHPAWHALMDRSIKAGLHAAPWADDRPGAHVARAAGFFLTSQVEAGHGCPISMTYSVLPALRLQPDVAARWDAGLTATSYDPSFAPPDEKLGLLVGMGMTERQGGSDVRANVTTATPSADGYRINGHKWFCSAPMNDAFLVLAQAPGGLSCFLLPRWTPEATVNGFHIMRLKDKLGNRSNASAEVEFVDAYADLIGEEGAGVRTILEMVNHTRLDCVIGSASGMRQAVTQAVHHATHRSAFGRRLVDQPLMVNVLADLVVESEAATLLMLRLAAEFDTPTPLRRLATPVAKYWVCKRLPPVVAEALECLGGNGYVEESILPRLFRESPVNSIWEGSGNVIALDALRALDRSPDTADALVDELQLGRGEHPDLDRSIDRVGRLLAHPDDPEVHARRITELLALTLQGSLLVRYATPAQADAFCSSRLGNDWGRVFGTLPSRMDLRGIVAGAGF